MKMLKYFITILLLISFKSYAQDTLVVDSNVIESTNQNSQVIHSLNNKLTNANTRKLSREFDFSSINPILQTKIPKKNTQLNHLTKDENFIDSPWFKVVVGTAISFGASAAYFKNKANDSDELYKKNGSRKDLDNRNKYDLYGGIALGALELNVGFLIYKFLTD